MEDELIRRAQEGDTAAFRALVERFTPKAWRVARILLRERGQAEDALQEAWIDVWRGLPRYDITRPFTPWLLAVVGNRCRMQRRRPNQPTTPLDEALAESIPDPTDAIAGLAADESDGALQTALAALSQAERELLALRYRADLELAEIAALYEMPLGTIKSRLYRSLATLRTKLGAATLEAH